MISSRAMLSPSKGYFSEVWDEFLKVQAFIKKDAKISVSYKMQFVFQFLQIFFGITIIYFIGKMLASSGDFGALELYGGDYFAFALIGLAVNSFLRAGLVSITNDIRQIMNQGTLEAMFATSTNYTWLMFCASIWQFLFETIRVGCYFVMGVLIFGLRFDNANWLPAIIVMALTAPIFLMLGINSCSILVVVKRGDPINWVFSSIGALLAGTMFPVSVLPGWLQTVSYYFPLTHSLDAARKCLLTGASFGQIKESLFVLLIFIVILVPVTIGVNQICMNYARKTGHFRHINRRIRMKQVILLMFGYFVFVGLSFAENKLDEELRDIPIEMVVLKPIELQTVSLWVPAVKSGPFINRSCRAQQNLANSSELSAMIDHQKEKTCPAEVARILAELASGSYEKELPLTIFNGWQWEYSYSLCQYENVSYTLSERGGSWEDCNEAILNVTIGEIALSWLTASSTQLEILNRTNGKSEIYLHTFSSMRIRDGYPKVRKL